MPLGVLFLSLLDITEEGLTLPRSSSAVLFDSQVLLAGSVGNAKRSTVQDDPASTFISLAHYQQPYEPPATRHPVAHDSQQAPY
ncbi:hypothetical protein HD553DRAFT_74639 [Filobasidium floriforme]|uniref:uncharacterized protein n=1 Tax=Filobasidium floriforme TaxID=5210 RepID=UPI001E8D98A3|nr:uncharacterized protein HD553DRAFT_74639 [Filobasidium floriforme]KAH8081812.1 hypothetical protein HD553DRAFT_74639 [Filobasidium floriforme]